MSGVFLCLIQNWEAAARRNFLLDRKDKQASLFCPADRRSGRFLPGGLCIFR